MPITDEERKASSVESIKQGRDKPVTTISATRLTDQLNRINVNSEALRERLRQAGAASQAVTPQINASDSSTEAAASSASVIWRKQALEVPADNTYEHLRTLTIVTEQVKTLSPTDVAAKLAELMQPKQAWASAPGDAISNLMARNFGSNSGGVQSRDFSGQWRGLGGALLSQLATSTSSPTQYRQTFLASVDSKLSLEDQFSSVKLGASTVHFQLKTRSGQTVDLQIVVNKFADGVIPGMQVSASSSGALSDAERKALAALSEGLDEALEGLGRVDAPEMNLSGLMNYDRSVFSSLDLDIEIPPVQKGDPNDTFALHLGEDKNTLAYKGPLGQMQMRLDAAALVRGAGTAQRQAAIAQYLKQIDAAAGRSHANEKLVGIFKSSFVQMHNLPESSGAAGMDDDVMTLLGTGLTDQVRPLLTGLSDFEASFSGEFERNNARGALNEQGEMSYALSQKTEVQVHRREKDASIVQTRSENLTANYAKARNGAELILRLGYYDRHSIRDSSTVTTLIEAVDGVVDSAVERTDKKQLHIQETLMDHEVTDRRTTPDEQHVSKRLV